MLDVFLSSFAIPFMAFLSVLLIYIIWKNSPTQRCKPATEVSKKPKRPVYDPNKIPKNPFIMGQVVHYGQFFGREQIIQDLFDLWGDFPNMPLQNAAIYGEKRIGKTSLLFHLKELAETSRDDPRWREGQKLDYLPNMQDYQFIYVSFQNPTYQTQQGFLQYLLQEMELAENVMLPETKPLIKFGEIISSLSKPTIILLDDADIALKNYHGEFDTNFWHGLRAITIEHSYLGFVATSNQNNLIELEQNLDKDSTASLFFNLFVFMEIMHFSDKELEALLGTSPKPFEVKDIEDIKEKTQGHPAKIQELARMHLINSTTD